MLEKERDGEGVSLMCLNLLLSALLQKQTGKTAILACFSTKMGSFESQYGTCLSFKWGKM